MTLYANHVAPFVATTFSLFGERLTITPQLRAADTTFTGYPGTPDALHAHLRQAPIRAARSATS